MSANSVRAGQAFVEIGADPRKLFAALGKINSQMGKFGKELSGLGGRMVGLGVAVAAPFAASARAGAQFQDVLLNLKASTGATAGEIDRIRDASMLLSKELGVGPTQAAAGFLELLKAGVDLETVLGGAGKAALAFSKVAGLDGATAATVLSKAMNAFGTDANAAANAMSSAADASATSIEEMAQAFSQASAVASTSNQSITDLSAALAVLANKGIVGSDAGTSIKTMLQKLKVPTTDAEKALAKVGLAFESFRGADGQLLPLVGIIDTLNQSLQNVGQATRDDVLGNVFGSDAIRAATILTQVGSEGFNAMQGSMAGAMSVGDKFTTMMSGLSGSGASVMASMERLGISISDAVAPAFQQMAPVLTGFLNGINEFVAANPALVSGIAQAAVGVAAFGSALMVVGGSVEALSFGLGGLGKVASVALSPAGLAVGALAIGFGAAYASGIKVADVGDAIKSSFGGLSGSVAPFVDSAVAGFNKLGADASAVFGDLFSTAQTTFGGISDALAAGDLAGAGDVLMLGLSASFQRGIQALMSYVDPFVQDMQDAFALIYTGAANVMDQMWTWIGQSFTSGFAVVQGVMDNAVNTLMATWDNLVASITKGWLYVRSFMESGLNLDRELAKVDSEVEARRVKREKERPGVRGRLQQADEINKVAADDRDRRIARRGSELDASMLDRDQRTRDRAMQRAAGVAATEGALTAKREKLGATREALDLLPSAARARDSDELRSLVTKLDGLRARGASSDMIAKIESAIDDRLVDLDKARAMDAAGGRTAPQVEDIAAGYGQTNSPSEVVGTFSAQALSGMGFGQSLTQKQLDAQMETNRILRERLEVGQVAG